MTRRQKNHLLTLLFVAFIVSVYLFRQSHLQRPTLGPSQNYITCGAPCGTERWAVKTLSDADASSVNFSPRPTTVAWLTAQPAPSLLPADTRIAPLELQAFTVRAQLVAIKEESDRDFHIHLADP